MFKKFQEYLTKKQDAIKKEQELRKAKRFYSFLKAGAAFVKFIQEDLKRTENTMNRHQRRRFEKEIEEKGMFSPELVNYYQQKIDWLLVEVDKRLNPPKQPKVQSNPNIQIQKEKPVDAK